MSRELNNIFELGLSSRVMIEASAGTGKTYTLVGLFIRLLIEKQLPPDRILIVTFTRMATKELKERILERLRDSYKALIGNETRHDDPFLEQLIGESRRIPDAAERIRTALQNFDEAQIYTIHGFCQKVLNEEALLTGTPFDIEVVREDDSYLEAASDFWRIFLYRHSSTEAGRYYINKVTEFAKTPEELIRNLQPLLEKPHAAIEAPKNMDITGYLLSVIQLRLEMKEIWRQQQNNILNILQNCDIRSYSYRLPGRLEKLNAFFDDEVFDSDAPGSLKYFTAGYLYNEKNLKKGGRPVPEHRFFELCNRYREVLGDMHNILPSFMIHAAEEIQKRRKEKTDQGNIFSYDDLLKKLQQALENRENEGDELARKLRKRYPYALVDEFQDTDPVQYDIFDRIYPRDEPDEPYGLVMIGDPKQAIYAFRGADVYAYLRARDSVRSGEIYTLEKNYRSSEALIEGVNALFSHSDNPFIEKEIRFLPVKPGIQSGGNSAALSGKDGAPLKVFVEEGAKSLEEAKKTVFRETAIQVAEWVRQGRNGTYKIDGENLSGGDIAVLISSHKDAEQLKTRLKELGIDSVTYSRENVLKTPEAERLDILMSAIAEPGNHHAISNLLISGWFGNDLAGIYDLREDEDRYQQMLDKIHDLRQRWQKDGFYSAFRTVMLEQEGLLHFARADNSERRITNLYHLAELCAFAERKHRFDMFSLLHWFRRKRVREDSADEDLLRLESDQDLVKISTVHNSKGLEFPLVICPVLWSSKSVYKSINRMIEYHSGHQKRLTFNLDPTESERRTEAETRFLTEHIAEETRKAYVALTRAKYECRIIWTAAGATPYSGLGALLAGEQAVKDVIAERKALTKSGCVSEKTYTDALRNLAKKHPDVIGVFDFHDESGLSGPASAGQERRKVVQRTWKGPAVLQAGKKSSSFSSLVHHEEEQGPDYDQWLDDYLLAADTEKPQSRERNIFTFPRGAAAGTVIHKLFEHKNFDFRTVSSPETTDAIRDVLISFGFDESWTPVLQNMLGDVCGAKIADLSLQKVLPEDHLREMEFNLRTAGPELSVITDVIRNRADGQIPDKQKVKSYLTGFIDLIVRQNGKYYIVDYKSNYLGDSPDDYHEDALRESIRAAGYDIQYHLYTLALVEMLTRKYPGFDYNTHFGGVAYLYVRGMTKETAGGVWFHKPGYSVIRNLQKLLQRS